MVAEAPEETSALRSALRDCEADRLFREGPHGTLVCLDPRSRRASPQRVLEFDRHGTLLTVASWAEGGGLRWAKLRLPDRRWLGIEPDAQHSPFWGKSDRLWIVADGAPFRREELLSHFPAMEYQAVSAIPPLAVPQRLPPGAGTAVLNFLASLLADQGTHEVSYQGPYATEQLFTTLLESFTYHASANAPLEQFMESDLGWAPAPHERRFLPGGIHLQLRDGVEKVVVGGKAYYRREWQSVIRREHRVVRQDGNRAICSLWILGEPAEDHLVLDAAGEVVEGPAQLPEDGPVEPLSDGWRSAILAVLAHQSAPPLRPWIDEAMALLAIDWGPVAGDLVAVGAERVVLSLRLPRRFRRRLAGCRTLAERLQLSLALISEVARILGPTIRLRAQERLAALSEATQRAALEAPLPPAPVTGLEELAQALATDSALPEA